MRANTSLHADQARRHVGEPRFDLAGMVVTSSNCLRKRVDKQHLYDASLRHSILASGLGNIHDALGKVN
jgi:hypothetical protein